MLTAKCKETPPVESPMWHNALVHGNYLVITANTSLDALDLRRVFPPDKETGKCKRPFSLERWFVHVLDIRTMETFSLKRYKHGSVVANGEKRPRFLWADSRDDNRAIASKAKPGRTIDEMHTEIARLFFGGNGEQAREFMYTHMCG